MADLVLISLTAILVLYCAAKLGSLWQRRQRLPPGPLSWPVIGSMHHLIGPAPHRSLAKLSKQYGPLISIMLGSKPIVVVSSPDMAKLFLHTHDKVFASRMHSEGASRFSYGPDAGMVLAPYGTHWREMRRLYTLQLFAAKRVAQFLPIMEEEIKRLVEEIREYARAGLAYNVTAGMAVLLENITCRILIGRRMSEVFDAKGGYDLKDLVHKGVLLFATPIVGDMIPWLSWLDSRTKRRMDAWHASFDVLLESVVQAREETAGGSPPNDLLDVLLMNNLPRHQVKGIILELMIAGIDTSSVMLDWAMAEVLQNKEVLTKVEQELERVIGRTEERIVNMEDVVQLPYCKAIVKETMRLRGPVALLVPHMATEDCEVAGYTFSKGTSIFINTWAIGREPQHWKNPDTFSPDRFLGMSSHVDVRGQHFELLPFGAGRRGCPGIPLALPIVEMTLATLFHSFRWSLPPPPNHLVDMSEKFGFVVSRSSPLLAIPNLPSNPN